MTEKRRKARIPLQELVSELDTKNTELDNLVVLSKSDRQLVEAVDLYIYFLVILIQL